MFNFKKSFGQNFLRDKNILKKIVDNFSITSEDSILEIGPGDGAITEYLSDAKKIIAIEKDKYLVKELKEKFLEKENFEIIEGDFLEQNIRNLNVNKVVGSIPYYITGLIIKKLLEESKAKEIFLIIQKEVAERLVATKNNKNYGILTLITQYYANVSIIFNISKNSFYPIPKVDSSMIKISIKENIKNEVNFIKCVKVMFAYRRKTILNNLSKLFTKEESLQIFNNLNIDPGLRAEDLDLEQFIKITEEAFGSDS